MHIVQKKKKSLYTSFKRKKVPFHLYLLPQEQSQLSVSCVQSEILWKYTHLGNLHPFVFYMKVKILPSLVLHVYFYLSQKYILEIISYQYLEQLHFKMNTPYAYLISLTSSWVICFHDTFILNNERVSILLSKVFLKIFLPEILSFHYLKEEFRIKMLG